MKHRQLFGLRLGAFVLEYDVNYGIDNRTGWSVILRGRVITQFATLLQCGRELFHYMCEDRDDGE